MMGCRGGITPSFLLASGGSCAGVSFAHEPHLHILKLPWIFDTDLVLCNLYKKFPKKPGIFV